MRSPRTFALLATAAAPLFFNAAKADTLTYTGTLLGSTVVPPTLSPATGTETVSLSGDLLTLHITFDGFGSPVTGASLHCCSDTYTPSSTVLTLTGFPVDTTGTYDHTFSLVTDLSGISESAFIQGLNSGSVYGQINSRIYPDGAIRGQLAAVSTAPEPCSLLLLCTGLASTLGIRRKHTEAAASR